MIQFLEHSSPKYPPRTYENASADLTIAFAFDFNTPGERLTYDAVKTQGKQYIQVYPDDINALKIKTTASLISDKKISTINIAGNSLLTIKKHSKKYDHTQFTIDALVYEFLKMVINNPIFDANITLIRSGGQSGFDEAGIKAAVRLGIPALCLCPKGWKYIDQSGITICDEQKFKNRFNHVLNL